MTKSWRDVLPIHPACELFPPLSPEELRALGEDIKQHGLRSPITLYQKRGDPLQLVDGRSRLDGIEVAGMMIKITKDLKVFWYADDEDDKYPIDVDVHVLHRGDDPYEFVLSANLHRRHLTAGQKRDVIAKLLQADPTKSDRQIAEQTKTSPTTVGKVRAEKEAVGDVSTMDTRTDTKGRQQQAHRTTSAPRKTGGDEPKLALELIDAGYRALATKHHPDRGGSSDAMAQLNQWRDRLKQDVATSTVSGFDRFVKLSTRLKVDELEMRNSELARRNSELERRLRDNVGPNSTGENQRLRARIAELEADKRRLEIKIVGLESELAELRSAGGAADLSIPGFLRREPTQ